MKKLIYVFLSIILVMSFVACNKEPGVTPGDDFTATNINETNGTEDTNETTSTDVENETIEQTEDNTEETERNEENSTSDDSSVEEEKETVDSTHVHTYTESTTKSTCLSDGYTTYTCTCGDSYVGDKVIAAGHKFGQWKTIKEPTETSTGTSERKCSVCNTAESKTLGKIIVNHKHSYKSSVTNVATCVREGVKTFTCSCGDCYTESINKVGHSYNATVVAATCLNGGHTTYKCSVCGDSYTDSHTAALNHNYKRETVAPTCTTNGYTKYVCTRCGASRRDTETSATGHNYVFASDTATCTSNGVKTETCTKCGSKKTTITYAFGHTLKTETAEATCTIDGYIKTACTTCHTVVSNTTTPATGHTKTVRVVAEIAQEWVDKGEYYYMPYCNETDWIVDACTKCGSFSLKERHFKYTALEAAEIMLGYVNDLRAEIYGTHYYDMVLDDKLLELANIRASEISANFSHFGGTHTNAGENILSGGYNIYDQFLMWKNSPEHYAIMINQDNKYFGYGFCDRAAKSNVVCAYGVQLFWTESKKDMYYVGVSK